MVSFSWGGERSHLSTLAWLRARGAADYFGGWHRPGQRRDRIVLAVFVVGLASAVIDMFWISNRLAGAEPMASARRWAQSR
jgi:hypothetical protein